MKISLSKTSDVYIGAASCSICMYYERKRKYEQSLTPVNLIVPAQAIASSGGLGRLRRQRTLEKGRAGSPSRSAGINSRCVLIGDMDA